MTGTQTCENGSWGQCSGGIPATTESCNGEDDDCDGRVDDLGVFGCGIGACRRTVPACVDGVLGVCVPGNPPSNLDECNGTDDDCDGAIDEDCGDCVRVTPTGNDDDANGADKPFGTVQAAIDFAATTSGAPPRVCVAAGPACGAAATFSGPEGADLTMRNGVSVYGNYEATSFTRCTNSVTTLAPTTALGVSFPSDIEFVTVLDGFTISRPAGGTMASITVDGATGVLLSSLVIPAELTADVSYGVNVVNGADVRIFRSSIEGGAATTLTIGVRAVGARVAIHDSYPNSLPNGTYCGGLGTEPSIRGVSNIQSGGEEGYAVWLEDATGSELEHNWICTWQEQMLGSAIKVVDDASEVVIRGNRIEGRGSEDSDGFAVSMQDCGAGPWIVNNPSILYGGNGLEHDVIGLFAQGDCAPTFEANSLRCESTGSQEASGIRCGTRGGASASCVIEDNTVNGVYSTPLSVVSQVRGVGVECGDGSCSRIEDNLIVGLAGPAYCSTCSFYGVGIDLINTSSFVAGNSVSGGCAHSTTGLRIEDGSPRVENNEISGFEGDCNAGTSGPSLAATALALRFVAGKGEPDIHSNEIRAAVGDYTYPSPNPPSSCQGVGVTLSGTFSEPRGIFRNNILDAGPCTSVGTNYSVYETSASVDPRVFENNVLGGAYRDEGATLVTMESELNALAGTTASENLFDSCLLPLMPGSPCIDAGTSAGSPLFDADGETRDGSPDVGPDEYVP
jgi:hypothetical protein